MIHHHLAGKLGTLLVSAPLCACGMASDAATAGVSDCRVTRGLTALPAEILEASGATVGLADSTVVWTHNDSGGEAEIFAVGSDGRVLGRPTVSGAENDDWESIASAPCATGSCLYLADTGDNGADRETISIYRIEEPDPTAAVTSAAVRFDMRYPEGPRDSEAIFVLPDEQIYLVTKGGNSAIEVYRYPGTPRSDATVVLEPVRTLSAGEVPLADRVTGAEASRDGRWIALRTRTAVLLYRSEDLVGNGGGQPTRTDLTSLGEYQGEGIGMRADGALVLTSEGEENGAPASLAELRCELSER